jgi:hypothetical protein
VLAAGEFVLLTSLEMVDLPLNLIARIGLTSFWARRGVVALFSPQVDPGFRGVIYVPMFNAGDVPVPITYGDKLITIDFQYTTADASFGWSDRNGIQTQIQAFTVPFASRPNLEDIRKLEGLVEANDIQMHEVRRSVDLHKLDAEKSLLELRSHFAVLDERVRNLLERRSGLVWADSK